MFSQLFYIISVNFILTFSVSLKEYKSIMLIMNNFSKIMSFISETKTMTEEQ